MITYIWGGAVQPIYCSSEEGGYRLKVVSLKIRILTDMMVSLKDLIEIEFCKIDNLLTV